MVNNATNELREIYKYCKEKRDELKKQIVKKGAYTMIDYNENFGKFDAYRDIVDKLDQGAGEYGIKL